MHATTMAGDGSRRTIFLMRTPPRSVSYDDAGLSLPSATRKGLDFYPFLTAGSAGLQERDEVVDLRRRQGLLEVLRHDVRLIPGRDHLVRVVDRLLDEGRVLAFERGVEIRADRPGGVRGLERVATRAALRGEDDLAVRRVALLRRMRWRRLRGRRARRVRAGACSRLLRLGAEDLDCGEHGDEEDERGGNEPAEL